MTDDPLEGRPAAPALRRLRAAPRLGARGLLACAAILLMSCGTAGRIPAEIPVATEKPRRVVSLNLCTDQLLMQMIDSERIRAISYLARDPRASAMASEAQDIAVTAGTAEEVIAMRPDLVFAGTFSTRETVAILRRLGYEVVEFEPETDFGDIRRNIRKLAAAVGEPARGEAMVRRIDARLAALPDPPTRRPVYADYNANGFTSGDGTLTASLANLAGFDTLGQRLGFTGVGQVSLEQMVVAWPHLIDLGGEDAGPALATQNYRHPALRRLMRERAVIGVPGKYTDCGSPFTLRALDAFLAARDDLQ